MTEASDAFAAVLGLLETPLCAAAEDAQTTLAELARSIGLDDAAFAEGVPVVAMHDGLEMTLAAERGSPRLLMSVDLGVASPSSGSSARRLLRANLDWMQTAGGVFASEDVGGPPSFFRIVHVRKGCVDVLKEEIVQTFALAAAWRDTLRDSDEDETDDRVDDGTRASPPQPPLVRI